MTNEFEFLSEAVTRAKLIDPAKQKQGWTENLIRREETAGSIEIAGKLIVANGARAQRIAH